jgi:flagellar L-ring protein precursor FlgH
MRNNGNHKTKRAGAAIRVIPAAVVLVLILTGCAAMQTKKDPAASFTPPPKQVLAPKPIPMPEPGPAPASLAPTGSIWAPSNGSLYADVRAAKIGDILTITISENSTASKASTTTAERAKNFQGSLTFAGAGSAGNATRGAFSFGPYNGAFSSNFKGDGTTTQNDSMTAYMTATVIDVLPNGNLLIRGSRWTKVNDELQQIVLEGVVRPVDISRNNTVLSQNVAEAKIFLLGKGPVAQNQKPGWLLQMLDFFSPF